MESADHFGKNFKLIQLITQKREKTNYEYEKRRALVEELIRDAAVRIANWAEEANN